jgi:hypothetical protein
MAARAVLAGKLWQMNLRSTLSVAGSSVGAVVGRTGELFTRDAAVHRGLFALDADARVPGSAQLFSSPEPREIYVRFAPSTASQAAIRTMCLKFPDAYGPGRDQDFLLASSGDGAPLHHVTLPVGAGQPTLYSSLWLYLAGAVPTLFGARADSPELGEGGTAEFCVSGPIGRFRRIGTVTLQGRDNDAGALDFAATHTGGNIRPLPPVTFY